MSWTRRCDCKRHKRLNRGFTSAEPVHVGYCRASKHPGMMLGSQNWSAWAAKAYQHVAIAKLVLQY